MMAVSDSSSQSVPKSTDIMIERLDNSHQKVRVQRQLNCLRKLSYSGIVCLVINTVYFAYRVKCSLDGHSYLSTLNLMVIWTFLGLEFSLALPGYLSCLQAASSLKRLKIRPAFRLVGGNVPTVDVLVPCCRESLVVILDTVRAACALDYPQDRYRVVVLDDGNSTDLKDQIAILKRAYRNLFYTARGINVVTHSKAGNLNHGLDFLDKLQTGSSEYVAVLDVDMIPMPNLLRALLPHLLKEPSFGIVTSPQYFYNIPDGDPLGQCVDYVFDITYIFRDISDGTSCTGTGFILRRAAVEDIKGFPTGQLSEAMMTTFLLRQKGWKFAFVWEPLQWGLVPDSYAGHAKQTVKWTRSFSSIIFALMGPRLRNLSAAQRLQSVGMLAYISSALSLTFALLFIPTILTSGRPLIASRTPQLRKLLMLSASQLLANWINGLMTSEAADFQTPIWPPYRHVFLAPFQSIGLLQSFFAIKRNFTPAGSALDGQRERESRASNSLIQRIGFALTQFSSWLQLFVIISSILGAIQHMKTVLSLDISSEHRMQKLLVGIAWPPAFVHWVMFIVEFQKSLSYAIFPPQNHPREALLSRDLGTKIAYPSAMAKDGKRIRSPQGLSITVLAYTILVLAGSWAMEFQ